MKVVVRSQHLGLVFVILLYLSLSLAFSLIIPLSKAPDEYVHFLYTRFLADHARPPMNPQERQAGGYKSDQPPLYHALVALVTSGIDISEPPSFKFTWEPHRRQLIDIVLPRAILVRTEDETWPYAGLFLAWFVGRWVSITLSAATIVVTYLITLEIFPGQRWLALATGGTLAFLPRYIFTGSVLNDDNLVGLLMAVFLWGIVRLVRTLDRASLGWFAMIGSLIGLALTTKYSVILVPFELTLLVIWLSRKQSNPWHYGFPRLFIAGLVTVAIASGWFGFVIWNFNQVDKLGPVLGVINPLIAGDASDETSALVSALMTDDPGLVSEADLVSAEGNLFDWLRFLFEQFWDVPVFGSPRLYPVIAVLMPALFLCWLAVFGWWRRWQRNEGEQRLWLGILLGHLFTFIPAPLLRFAITGQIHDTAQARHVLFPTAPALAILLVAGVIAAFPKRWHWPVILMPVGFTFTLALLHFYYYTYAFPPPLPVRSDPLLADLPGQSRRVTFDDGLQLQGYDWQLRSKEQLLELSLYWRSTALAHDDYRTEINLYDSSDNIRRRWLSHPAQGRFPTRAWDVGDSVRDTLQIPLLGLPSGDYKVTLRLLDWQDDPLPSTDGETILLTNFKLDQASTIQAPLLWLAGRPAGSLPLYRYRAAIPLLTPAGRQANLVGPTGQLYSAEADMGGLHLFTVSHHWPSGQYWVQLDGTETGLTLQVENFDWNFTPPDLMYRVEANFNGEIQLLGYDLPMRRVEVGSGIPLVLYWQSLRRLTKSYIIFDRLLDANQQPWGGYDRLPKETYPTDLWIPGEVVADGFVVPVAPDAPDGVYNIVVGLYDEADPAARSLPLVAAGERLNTTHVTIGPIKVGGPPSGITVNDPIMEQAANVNFGNIIRLSGYDLRLTDHILGLSLFWESLARTETDYTVFVHVLDESGNLIRQGDHAPAEGKYPTSLWEVGEIIQDSVEIPLSKLASGRYSIIIGLYNQLTGERLMAAVSSTGPQDNAAGDSYLLQTFNR